jgi:hypothetical protein
MVVGVSLAIASSLKVSAFGFLLVLTSFQLQNGEDVRNDRLFTKLKPLQAPNACFLTYLWRTLEQ